MFCDSELDKIRHLEVEPDFSISPTHKLITYGIDVEKNTKKRKISPSGVGGISILEFCLIAQLTIGIHNVCPHACVIESQMGECLSCMVALYRDVLQREYNNMCPLLEKEIVERDNTPWFNSEIARAIKHRRSKEKKWRNLKTVESRRDYVHAKNEVNGLIRRRKCSYYRQKTADVDSDAKRLHSLLDSFTGNVRKKRFPEGYTDTDLAN